MSLKLEDVKKMYPRATVQKGVAYDYVDERFSKIGDGFAVDKNLDNQIDYFILEKSLLPSTVTSYTWGPNKIFHEENFAKKCDKAPVPGKECFNSSPPFATFR